MASIYAKLVERYGALVRLGVPIVVGQIGNVVLGFADTVEACYQSCQPKKLPEDEFSRRGYQAFWNEWHRRRGEK